MSFGGGGRCGGGCGAGGARAPTLSLGVVGFGAEVRESFAPTAGVSREMPRIAKIKKKVNCSFIVSVCSISRQICKHEIESDCRGGANIIYVRRAATMPVASYVGA